MQLTCCKALRRYQATPAGSRASFLPLIKLVARAIHRVTVLLFQLDDTCHKGESLIRQEPPYPFADDERASVPQVGHPPIPFTLIDYCFPDQYPGGATDLAGYRAEDQIFGGVVVFERKELSDEVRIMALGMPQFFHSSSRLTFPQYRGLWFHSHRQGVTRRLYALTENQETDLKAFLLAKQDNVQSQQVKCPLPILGTADNVRRVDAVIAIPEFNIYRDRWERKIEKDSFQEYLRTRRDVVNTLDYPSRQIRSHKHMGGPSGI